MAETTITYSRSFSDGNYGSERLDCTLSRDLPSPDDPAFIEGVHQLVATARAIVLSTLATSARASVSNAAASECNTHGIPTSPHPPRLRPVGTS